MAISRSRGDEVERADTESGEFDAGQAQRQVEGGGLRAVYPQLDGQGGTRFTYGSSDEEASYEEWAAQNGVAAPGPSTEAVDEEDDGVA